MTPTEYLKIEAAERLIIQRAEAVIADARKRANKCKPPKNRRPAKASDIKVGAVIWHEREKRHGGDFWHVVDEVRHPEDSFKAYVANDGCRYGLAWAYVEVVP